MNLYKPSELLKFLSDLNIKPKKKLSQNFLVDNNIVKKFIESSCLTKDDIVLEIGPGPGVLTKPILEIAKKLIVIEKDDVFSKNLINLKANNLEIKHFDFLKIDLDFLKVYNQKIKVISSIPYHLTSPIIAKLLESSLLFSSITLMVQKEVAERIVSSPNSKIYSSFSVFVQFYSDVKIISKVSKNSFLPKPKVDSAIIKLTLKENLENIEKNKFHALVRLAFSQRRKKIISPLSSNFEKNKLIKIFNELNLDLNSRAENLSLENFLSLYKKLF
jgi:16S rRNA (adenine1518-N6/adenine1519-N6)-dimethyltransferase